MYASSSNDVTPSRTTLTAWPRLRVRSGVENADVRAVAIVHEGEVSRLNEELVGYATSVLEERVFYDRAAAGANVDVVWYEAMRPA